MTGSSDPGAAGAPLPSEDDADRYFTGVAPLRAGAPESAVWPISRRARAAIVGGVVALSAVLATGATLAVLADRGGAPVGDTGPGRATTVEAAGLSVCLEAAPAYTTDPVTAVPCDVPSARYIVRTRYDLPAGHWPGEDVVSAEADGLCRKFFASSNATASPPPLADPAVVPRADRWAAGDRTIFCLLPL